MNLINDPWLIYKLQDGTEQTLPITAIADPRVVDFALPRADFQGAAYQFSIALLQTTFAPEDTYQWHDLYEQAPTEGQLNRTIASAAHAFNTLGDGPLFMQDLDPLNAVKPNPVAGLLIEAPGKNTLKLNTDHFIKREATNVMSLAMANLALFTLQINAPSGGRGHRAGLRGGGPLTTLVLPQQAHSTLWQKLWLNIINRDEWRYTRPDLHSPLIFPWLHQTKTSEAEGSEIYASDLHPLAIYWAMPRRIRLDVIDGQNTCQISGLRATKTVARYRTKHYGHNYSGTWQHPLTAYKWDPNKPELDHLSAKGQQGGVTYKTWPALVFASNKKGQACARVVSHFYTLVDGFSGSMSEVPRLWAFGYDMDNAKARGWYATSLPLFNVPVEQHDDIWAAVQALHKVADSLLKQCRGQIKKAWFGDKGKDKDRTPSGDYTFIDLAFWQTTEDAFYTAAQQVIEQVSNNQTALLANQASQWLAAMRRAALALFDEYALSGLGNERSMAKRVKARLSLVNWLYASKDIKTFINEHNIESTKESN